MLVFQRLGSHQLELLAPASCPVDVLYFGWLADVKIRLTTLSLLPKSGIPKVVSAEYSEKGTW